MVITTAADNILVLYFSVKIRLDQISCESSAMHIQMIQMKYLVIFSLKNNKKQIRMLSATFLLSTYSVNHDG